MRTVQEEILQGLRKKFKVEPQHDNSSLLDRVQDICLVAFSYIGAFFKCLSRALEAGCQAFKESLDQDFGTSTA